MVQLHIFINNIKVVGIFLAVNFALFIPVVIVWILFNSYRTSDTVRYILTFLLVIAAICLYFIASRRFIKSTGNLFYDALSLAGVAVITIIILTLLPNLIPHIQMFFYYPFTFLILRVWTGDGDIRLGVAIASLISMAAVFVGIIKSK